MKSREGNVIGGLLKKNAAKGVFGERLLERGLWVSLQRLPLAIDNAYLAAEAQRQLAERTQAQNALSELNRTLANV